MTLNEACISALSILKQVMEEKLNSTNVEVCLFLGFMVLTAVLHGPGEFRGSLGLRGCRGRTKNPPNKKSAEFILTLGGNEFRGHCGFQGEMFSQVSGKIC